MNPLTETVIWPHDNNEIYSLYDKIFDCRGHGWSNLQSVHINLPFKDELEFRKLHSAIRLLLPIIPALSASSPFADGTIHRNERYTPGFLRAKQIKPACRLLRAMSYLISLVTLPITERRFLNLSKRQFDPSTPRDF